MKAAVVCANEDVQYLDYEEPTPGPGEVKVKVKCSGICGSDIPRVLHNGVHFYPIVLGHEFSGDVVEVGEGVTKVKVGDHVSGAPLKPCMKCDDCQNGNFSLCKHYSFIGSREQGSNADYVVIPEQNAVVYDPGIPYEQAAMFEPATVAIHGVFQNDYQGGQYVAVLGGGTIGMFTMQWCKIFGSKKVVVFDISDERLELAKRLGADEVVNTTKENFMEEAMAITGGKGYGFVFETAGQVPTMHMAFELAGNKSHVCFIGTPHVNLEFTPAMWENMNRKEFKLTGSWMSYSAPFPGKEWDLAALNAELLPIVPLNKIVLTDAEKSSGKVDDLVARLQEETVALYEQKEKEFEDFDLREIERIILLKVIDRKWMDHIDDMDQLREGIGLQAYGQRDPVVEYRMAGFEMFNDMTKAIQEETTGALFHVQVEQKIEREEAPKITGTNKDAEVEKKPYVRKGAKVGRNDPCPCGSGKKYKNCCGRNK